LRRARNLDVQVGTLGQLVYGQGGFDGRLGVARQQRRYLHRHPAVRPLGAVPNRPEDVGRAPQILEGEFDEQGFARESGARLLLDAGVVARPAADGLVENRRVGREPGDGQFVDVARSVPLSRMSRVMLSSQRLCPKS